MELRERYFSVAEAEWPGHRAGNLRFYLDYLFEGIELAGARVLDIGAGPGRYSFYAAAAGAEHVVALEPEAAGSGHGVASKFEQVRDRLDVHSVELRQETLQDFDPGAERFDVLLLHASINHLDEPATMALHRDEGARQVYRELFAKLAGMAADGAKLVAVDASRHNLFARLPIKNPLQPTLEWDKHQAPETWAGLLGDVGFSEPRVRWSTLNTLRAPGRALLGNRAAAWLLDGSFCLTMVLRKSENGRPSNSATAARS